MCGIFGILSKDGGLEQHLNDAVRSLAHRGPDDSGTEIIDTRSSGQLGLAHTRLAIIDLSPLGNQPMCDRRSGNWIVFNGEIYNFRELRAELESAGASFRSHSDTEVILAAYRAWGENAFPKLRGMFAFALWDANRQRLLLARDPMGIKPLYYVCGGKQFLFASEVRALLRTGLIPQELDPDGLFSYLAFGSVYEPHTIVKGINAVPAGNVVSFQNGCAHVREFWTPLSASDVPADDDSGSSKDAEARLSDLVRDAVLSHLVSDVPVGVFLSGGIDSSSLVAVMSKAGIRPSTFSLVFRETEFNEAPYSRLIARTFGTNHHEIMVSQEDALAGLSKALCDMDQPTIDGINTWLLSSWAHTAGVKVALTGLGADEMFGGYSTFHRVPSMELAASGFARLPSALRKPVAASIAVLGGNNDRSRKVASLTRDDSTHPYFLTRTLFTSNERQALFAGDCQAQLNALQELEKTSMSASQGLDPVNRVSYLESSCYMRNTLLRDSDFMSMAHGLELRVPFLDHALVKACFRIPGERKLQGESPKSLLLSGIGVDLPREVVNRPKRGFTLPFEHWMRAEMRGPLEESLLQESPSVSYLNPRAIAEVWNRYLGRRTSWSRPWSLFVLLRWCRENL